MLISTPEKQGGTDRTVDTFDTRYGGKAKRGGVRSDIDTGRWDIHSSRINRHQIWRDR